MPKLVFVDTETTGLEPGRHEVWEIAYAVDDGPVLSSFVGHSAAGADPVALQMNGYLARFVGQPMLGLRFEADFFAALAGATIVAANPAFDAAMLLARYGHAPWHYRLWDVEAYGAGVLGLVEVPSLKVLSGLVRDMGHDVPEPDHTAAADVAALRATFRGLQQIAADVVLGAA